MDARIQRRWYFVLLLMQLSVITLVLVLPQVDLLDTAFQNDSEPLAVHALAVAAPLVLSTAAIAGWMPRLEFHKPYRSSADLPSSATTSESATSPLRC